MDEASAKLQTCHIRVNEGKPSRTAIRVAMRRAAHQLFDFPIVFNDPLAVRILGTEIEQELLTNSEEEKFSPLSCGMRAFFCARSLVAEESLRDAVEDGVTQYVVLGAGLDTFAYRNPFTDLMVFEVDYPATQEWKRGQLQRAGIEIPPNLTFAPVDFERQTLEQGVIVAGVDPSRPAFFSCLGVIPYLTNDAVDRTFRFTGSFPSRSGLTFDYAMPRENVSGPERVAFDMLAERVAAAGEPFRFFATPEKVTKQLKEAGFSETENLDGAAINARYFTNRSDCLALRGTAAHIMTAWVR